MSLIGNLFVNVKANTSGLTRGLDKSKKSVKQFGASMQRVGRNLTLKVTAPLAALGFTSVKAAAAFEVSMSRVAALTQETGKALQKLENLALSLGETTVFTASQSAEAMAEFALAGFNTEKIMSSMAATLDLAAAAQIGVREAASITTGILGGMGIQAKDLGGAVDIMTQAFITARTDLPMLGEGLKVVGPLARSAGIGFRQVVSSLQALANAGFQGAEGGTILRNFLLIIAGTTPVVKKKIAELGVEVKDVGGGFRDLSDIVGQFNNALGQLGPVDKLAKLGEIFGRKQAAGVGSLLNTGEEAMRGFNDRLKDLGDVSGDIARIQLDNLTGSITKLLSAIEGLQIRVGKIISGPLRSLVDKVKSATAWFGNLSKSTKITIITIAGIAAAIGPVVFIVGSLITGIGKLIVVATGIAKIGVMFGLLLGPIGLTIAAVVALATVIEFAIGAANNLAPAMKDAHISGFDADIEKGGVLGGVLGSFALKSAQGQESQAFKAKAATVRQDRINRGLPVADGPTKQEQIMTEQLNELKQMRMEQKQGFENQERALNDLGGGA